MELNAQTENLTVTSCEQILRKTKNRFNNNLPACFLYLAGTSFCTNVFCQTTNFFPKAISMFLPFKAARLVFIKDRWKIINNHLNDITTCKKVCLFCTSNCTYKLSDMQRLPPEFIRYRKVKRNFENLKQNLVFRWCPLK